jgi:periodic tryptophan protein 2
VGDRSDGTALKLHGAKAVDMSSRSMRLEVRVTALQFSPTGRSFCAVTTEGLLVYSLDRHLVFDPLDLDTKITPQRIRKELDRKNYNKALVMAIKLAEKPLIRQVLESVPHTDISLLAQQTSLAHLPSLMFVAEEAEVTRHIQFYLLWTKALLLSHGTYLKSESKHNLPVLNLLIKNLTRKSEDLGKICDHIKYSIRYLIALRLKGKVKSDDEMEVTGKVTEVDNDEDSDVDMTELAAKWSDDGDE